MKLTKAIKIVEEHNAWRRGDDDLILIDPKTIGKAIDTVIIAAKFANNIDTYTVKDEVVND